jgi:GIY-YIG catalytic domain
MIDLITLLKMRHVPVATHSLKIHLAVHNGKEHPLDQYITGRFDAWQAQQSQRNFECEQVIGLIDFSREGAAQQWLFAGLYTVHGSVPNPGDDKGVIYQMQRVPGLDDMAGRVVVHYARSGRASYIWYQESQSYQVSEIRPKPMSLATFPGYNNIVLMHRDLRTITQLQPADWRTALSHVNGIYVITDTYTGRQYVGQAAGKAGVWGRWNDYIQNGHGGNKQLKEIIDQHGLAYAEHFQYAMLEVIAMYATIDEIHAREQHWMRVLQTRQHGLN